MRQVTIGPMAWLYRHPSTGRFLVPRGAKVNEDLWENCLHAHRLATAYGDAHARATAAAPKGPAPKWMDPLHHTMPEVQVATALFFSSPAPEPPAEAAMELSRVCEWGWGRRAARPFLVALAGVANLVDTIVRSIT